MENVGSENRILKLIVALADAIQRHAQNIFQHLRWSIL